VTVVPSTAPRPVRSASVSAPADTEVPIGPLPSLRVEHVPLVSVDRTSDPVLTPREKEAGDPFQTTPSLDTREPDPETPRPSRDESVLPVFLARDSFPMSQVPMPTSVQTPDRSSLSTAAVVSDWLQQAVTRLQVGEGSDGKREVRFDIQASVLPGVRVVLQEANGRVQVDFICSVDASRHVLSEIAQREASEMARRCRRDLLLRVHTEDEDPDLDPALRPRAIEVLGIA
jgi:hypothetical protein